MTAHNDLLVRLLLHGVLLGANAILVLVLLAQRLPAVALLMIAALIMGGLNVRDCLSALWVNVTPECEEQPK